MKIQRLLLIVLACGAIGLNAQTRYATTTYRGNNSNQLGTQLANMNQDLELLRDQIGRLKQEIAQLRQENSQLRTRLDTQEQHQVALAQDVVSRPQLDASIKQLRQEWQTEQAQQKQAIAQDVSAQIDQVTVRFNRSLKTLADSVSSQPKVVQEVNFTDDYPQTGVPYVVQSGDTLSEIARRFNSSVRDIQNANRIARPSRDLKIGQTIFIPQAE